MDEAGNRGSQAAYQDPPRVDDPHANARSLRIYFNHVPKCGGTSLNEILCRGMRRDQLGIAPFAPTLELYTLDGTRLERLSVVGSHFPHWAASRRMPGWIKLTTLREPWSRFNAMTRHLLRIAADTPAALDAAQCRFLSLIRERRLGDALRQSEEWYPAGASMAACFMPDTPGGGLRRDAGAVAASVLGDYDLVLLTESLDEDSALLDRALNGPPLVSAARLNTSRSYGDADAGPFLRDQEDQFHAQFPYELETYIAGARRRERTLPRVPALFEARPATHEGGLLFGLDWDGPVRCGGFSDRTRAASSGYTGRYARTIVADAAVVEFDVPEVCDCRLEAVFWIEHVHVRDRCRVWVNGVLVEMFGDQEVICPGEPHQVWSSALLDRSVLGSGKCRMEIRTGGAGGMGEVWLLDLVLRRRSSLR